MNLNTTQIEILKAKNGFSVAVNRPLENPNMPFDMEGLVQMVEKLEKRTPGDEWKELTSQRRPLKSMVAKKPQSELRVFANFDEMVEWLRTELK